MKFTSFWFFVVIPMLPIIIEATELQEKNKKQEVVADTVVAVKDYMIFLKQQKEQVEKNAVDVLSRIDAQIQLLQSLNQDSLKIKKAEMK